MKQQQWEVIVGDFREKVAKLSELPEDKRDHRLIGFYRGCIELANASRVYQETMDKGALESLSSNTILQPVRDFMLSRDQLLCDIIESGEDLWLEEMQVLGWMDTYAKHKCQEVYEKFKAKFVEVLETEHPLGVDAVKKSFDSINFEE